MCDVIEVAVYSGPENDKAGKIDPSDISMMLIPISTILYVLESKDGFAIINLKVSDKQSMSLVTLYTYDEVKKLLMGE